MRRRQYLAVAGSVVATGVAGCGGDGGGDTPSEDPTATASPEYDDDGLSNRQVEQTDDAGIVTYDIDVPRGSYGRQASRLEATVRGLELEVSLERNPGELYVFDRRKIDKFENGERVSDLGTFHGTGSSISVRGTLPSGSYYVVVDNSAYGDQSPQGDITGELTYRRSI